MEKKKREIMPVKDDIQGDQFASETPHACDIVQNNRISCSLEVARFSVRDVTMAKIIRTTKLPSSPPPDLRSGSTFVSLRKLHSGGQGETKRQPLEPLKLGLRSSLNFIRLLRVVITPQEKTTRSNRMNFRLPEIRLTTFPGSFCFCFVFTETAGRDNW